jgi:hypothetical protein
MLERLLYESQEKYGISQSMRPLAGLCFCYNKIILVGKCSVREKKSV